MDAVCSLESVETGKKRTFNTVEDAKAWVCKNLTIWDSDEYILKDKTGRVLNIATIFIKAKKTNQ